MRDRATVLIDHEDDRQTGVQQFSFTLRSRLLYRIKNFLKRNNRDHGRDYVLIAKPGLPEAVEANGFEWLGERVDEVLGKAAA